MSCCATAFSKIFERNGRIDIFSGSRFGFFKRDFITATFSEFGTHPVDRELFIMFNIIGPSTGRAGPITGRAHNRAKHRKQLFQ